MTIICANVLRRGDSIITASFVRYFSRGDSRRARRYFLSALLIPGVLAGAALIGSAAAADEKAVAIDVHPLLVSSCLDCHSGDDAESGIRLERLTGAFEAESLRLWSGIRQQIARGKMPPEDGPQLAPSERAALLEWIDRGLQEARSRPDERNGQVRRLTAGQYRNTLRDLLGLRENVAESLPPDGVSRDGFTNNVQSLLLSPLQVEAYLDIAERALDLCIVDESSPPTVQSFRMSFGREINQQPESDELVLGALSALLDNTDFVVTQPVLQKPFDFHPFSMRTSWRFIEGYQGNDTVRGWREYDSIYHAVFACVRGAPGYPRGQAWETIPDGLLLRPSISSTEVFQVDSTYGPQSNFKVALRELPDGGRFRVTVRAARYEDGLLLPAGVASAAVADDSVTVLQPTESKQVIIPESGIWQVDVEAAGELPEQPPLLQLRLGEKRYSGALTRTAFLAVRLPEGRLSVTAEAGDLSLERIVFTKLSGDGAIAEKVRAFERRSPYLGVHIGLRRDCGSTLAAVGAPQEVLSFEPQDYVFEGAIRNYPSPGVEEDNVNYLAGIREIALRSENTDGRQRPRLLLESVQFEGPYYETWPPRNHQRIFVASSLPKESPAYARLVIREFASRAFRRPITGDEEDRLFEVWRDVHDQTGRFEQAVQSALQVVLTSPQFLFLTEVSASPEPERLDEYELASKLSYFLWNTAPDHELLELAAAGRLHAAREQQVQRMIADPRFDQGAEQFVSEWLDLRRLDVVEVDQKRFPQLTDATRAELRKEPVRFVQYLIRENLPLQNLLQSPTLMANEVVAAYYGLADRVDSGFEFIPVEHRTSELGGLLTQAGVLAGLSNGREANPVRRGAWLARRIIAEPPADPPPNVPDLSEDHSDLPLREQLERHRSQEGCAACHAGIDPWGLPLEQYDAGGRWRDESVDGRSELPDGTIVESADDLRAYLASERADQVAFSFLRHLAAYASGRSLTWNEIEFLREHALELEHDQMRLRDLVQFVIGSDSFLMK